MRNVRRSTLLGAVVAISLGAAVVGCASSGGISAQSAEGGEPEVASVVDAGVDADSGSETDAPPGADVDADANTGPCVDSLDRVRNVWGIRCGDTATKDVEAGLSCQDESHFSCGDLNAVGYAFGTHNQFCFYPADGGTLVAATADDDVPSFCAYTSRTLSAGSVREESDGGEIGWSVSGQPCAPVLTLNACTPDASPD